MSEWPLVAFTLLVQISAGMVLFIALCGRFTDTSNTMRPALLAAAVLGCLGLLTSTMHMGYPWNAFHALRHISSSWLSREVVFAALYLGALCLYTLIVLLKKTLNRGIIALIALLGLVDIYCMASLYYHTSMLTWMHVNTYIQFFAAAVAAGAAVVTGLVALRPGAVSHGDAASRIVTTALTVMFLAVVIRLAAQPFYADWLAMISQQNAAVTFPHDPLAAYATTSALRMIATAFSVAGLLLTGITLLRKRSAVLTGGGAPVVLLGSLCIILGEILSRFVVFIVE